MTTELHDIAARLDRLAARIEAGASWESAGHLRNYSTGAIRSLARDVAVLAQVSAREKGRKEARHE